MLKIDSGSVRQLPDSEKPQQSTAAADGDAREPIWYGMLQSPVVVLVVAAYFALNLGLNLFNSFLLGPNTGQVHLPIPTFYTFCHQVACVLFLSVWCLLAPSVRFPVVETFRSNWMWLMPTSLIYAANIAANNASLASISLTINVIVKSCIPLPTMLLSYLVEGKTYSPPIWLIVLCIVGGVMLAIPFQQHPTETELIGYALVTFSAIATAIRTTIAARLMSIGGGGSGSGVTPLSAVAISFFESSLGGLMLLPVALLLELRYFDEAFAPDVLWLHVGYVGIGSAMAGVFNPTLFYTIKLTSSLAFTVLGNVKQLAMMAGAAYLDHVSHWNLWLSIAIVGAASVAYSYQTTVERQLAAAQKPSEATPLKTSRRPDAV